MAKVPNGVETSPQILTGWLGCASVTGDRHTDGRQHIANVNVSRWKRRRNVDDEEESLTSSRR